MIYILIMDKYPPFFIRKSKRGEYLDSMANADFSNLNEASPKHYKMLIDYLVGEMINSYWSNFLV